MKIILVILFSGIIWAENCDSLVSNISISENEQKYYIDYDKTWDVKGTLIFSSDLECHIASIMLIE